MSQQLNPMALLAQDGGNGAAAGAAGGLIFMVVYLGLIVLFFAGLWKVFAKAGKPGWAAIIPFYNAWVMVEIAGKSPVWFVLLFIPCVNIIVGILINLEIAKAFGKGAGFGLGLALLGFIFYPILGFSDARYQGPSAVA